MLVSTVGKTKRADMLSRAHIQDRRVETRTIRLQQVFPAQQVA